MSTNGRVRRDARPTSRFLLHFLGRFGGLRGRGSSLSLFFFFLWWNTQEKGEGTEWERKRHRNFTNRPLFCGIKRYQHFVNRYNDLAGEKRKKK